MGGKKRKRGKTRDKKTTFQERAQDLVIRFEWRMEGPLLLSSFLSLLVLLTSIGLGVQLKWLLYRGFLVSIKHHPDVFLSAKIASASMFHRPHGSYFHMHRSGASHFKRTYLYFSKVDRGYKLLPNALIFETSICFRHLQKSRKQRYQTGAWSCSWSLLQFLQLFLKKKLYGSTGCTYFKPYSHQSIMLSV